jgi:hypothetical protein
MLKMLIKLPRRNTDSLIGAVAAELAIEGIELVDSTCFLQEDLPEVGTITRREPDAGERGDIEYGLEIAHEIARLDLGQTIVVRGKACVAIEAMEGTDATISRAGELMRGRTREQKAGAEEVLIKLSSGPLTVIKIAKPNQDMRFDVPVIGASTIEAMAAAGATCLCISAGKTLIFDREKTIALANEKKVTVIAV